MTYGRLLALKDAPVRTVSVPDQWPGGEDWFLPHSPDEEGLYYWIRMRKAMSERRVKAEVQVSTYAEVLAEVAMLRAEISDLKSRVSWLYQLLPSIAAVQERFDVLVEQWRRETGMLSSITEKTIHPAYLQVISIGPVIIPLILKELRTRGGHWYYGLEALANALDKPNPGLGDGTGNIAKLKAAWLEWGKNEGYLA